MRISDWSSDVCSSDLEKVWQAALVATTLRRSIWERTKNTSSKGPDTPAMNCMQVFMKPQASAPKRLLAWGTNLAGINTARKGMMPNEIRTRARSGTKPTKVKSRSEEHTSELQSLMRISYAVV